MTKNANGLLFILVSFIFLSACAHRLTPEEIARQQRGAQCSTITNSYPGTASFASYNACMAGENNLDQWMTSYYKESSSDNLCDWHELSPQDGKLLKIIKLKKLNCTAVENKKHENQLAAASNDDLCQQWSSHKSSYQGLIDNEVHKRGLNCYQVLSLLQQKQAYDAQIAQLEAARAQQAQYQAQMESQARWTAFSQAMQNVAQQQQEQAYQQQMINAANRPVQTNCMRVGYGQVNCTSY